MAGGAVKNWPDDEGGGGGGPIKADEDIPDNEAMEATDDLPMRWFKALLAPSLCFNSEAACLRISWACALKIRDFDISSQLEVQGHKEEDF